MIQIIPEELTILLEMYALVQSLGRYQKPDYQKVISQIGWEISKRQLN